MWWNTEEDCFYYKYKELRLSKDILSAKRIPTKREVLRAIMLIYDPLGLISFFVVAAKILLQDIWQSKIGWDDPIKRKQYEKWIQWLNILPLLSNIKIQRCYFIRSIPKKIELHIFVDSSELAMAAVAYIRITYDHEVDVNIIAAKSKVAPVKPISIPILELQATLIVARLEKMIKKSSSIQIKSTVYWSDSRNVFSWIKKESRCFKQFVGFRISEIKDIINPLEWHWVASMDNVADEAMKNKDLIPKALKDTIWFSGPAFLKESPEKWPNEEKTIHIEDLVESMKLKPINIHQIQVEEYM